MGVEIPFDLKLSDGDLKYSEQYKSVRRDGSNGCYPAACLPIVGGKLSLSVELVGSMSDGNSFSFGVAQSMRKAWGDGFGKEKTSVGMFQAANETESVGLWDTLNSSDRAHKGLSHVLKKGDTVGLVVSDGLAVFSINKREVGRFPAPGVTVAGCTLNTNGGVRIIESSSSGSGAVGGGGGGGSVMFSTSMSATELRFKGQQVKRPGTSGCYPLAAVLVPPGSATFSFAVKMLSSTDNGNAFSFGVAQKIRKTYGDGFGKERTSVGIFQSCSASGSISFCDNLNSRPDVSLSNKIVRGDVIALVISGSTATFTINGRKVGSAPVSGINFAGCTLHTDGEIEIVAAPQEAKASPAKSEPEPSKKAVRALSRDMSSRLKDSAPAPRTKGHDPAIRRRGAEAPSAAPGLPPGTNIDPVEWANEEEPAIIISYSTAAANGHGLTYTWALTHELQKVGLTVFHGRMVFSGDSWQEQWYGLMQLTAEMATGIALVLLSEEYFKSEACVNELRAICKQFDSNRIIPVMLGGCTMRGDFLGHCEFLGKPFERKKIAGFFRGKIDGNCLPPPDVGVFQDKWATHVEQLITRVKQIKG